MFSTLSVKQTEINIYESEFRQRMMVVHVMGTKKVHIEFALLVFI